MFRAALARLPPRSEELVPSQPVIAAANGTPEQVVRDFLADMKAVEVWAVGQAAGDDDWDVEEVRERLRQVRERYLTPRRVADRDFAVGFVDPPLHDPNRTRVVEVTARRRDRALVVTIEWSEEDPPLESRYENRLHLINGECVWTRAG